MASIGSVFRGIQGAKSQNQMARELGIQGPTVSAVKNADRGFSTEVARKVASASGEKPATLYLVSQVAALKKDVLKDRIGLDGMLRRVGTISKAVNGGFRPDEVDQKDADFREAKATLKAIGELALDLTDGREAPRRAPTTRRSRRSRSNATPPAAAWCPGRARSLGMATDESCNMRR